MAGQLSNHLRGQHLWGTRQAQRPPLQVALLMLAAPDCWLLTLRRNLGESLHEVEMSPALALTARLRRAQNRAQQAARSYFPML